MALPFANELPDTLRRIGRAVLGPGARQRLAADLQHLAHLQSRRHPLFRESDRRLGEFKDRHAGETCVIAGNGPSLKDLDLGTLEGVPVFCLNRGYLLWHGQGRVPAYHVAINDLVIEQFHAEIAGLGCPLFLPWQYHRLFQGAPDAIFLEMRWHPRFFPDVRRGLWPGATVTFAAMQIAYHMGFRRVVLVGVDHRFSDKGPAHAEVLQDRDDENHFAPGYFGKGVRWNLPDLEQSEYAYRLAKDAYARHGREIVDATQGGALRVFPRMSLAEALAKKTPPRG